MNTLIVRYERFMPKTAIALPRQIILRKIGVSQIESLRTLIDGDHIDEIILCGSAVCTGWRIGVRRSVSFVERPSTDEQDAIAQNQAAMRIVELTKAKTK